MLNFLLLLQNTYTDVEVEAQKMCSHINNYLKEKSDLSQNSMTMLKIPKCDKSNQSDY